MKLSNRFYENLEILVLGLEEDISSSKYLVLSEIFLTIYHLKKITELQALQNPKSDFCGEGSTVLRVRRILTGLGSHLEIKERTDNSYG
jgi:hypothetical protein